MEALTKTPNGWARRGKARRPPRGVRDVGRWGEWIALRHLRRLGWDLLARNWETSRGEIDLIAFDKEVLVFVEVKSRLTTRPAPPPEENISREKEARLEILGGQFMVRNELNSAFRFDVIAIETPDLENYELRHFSLF